MVYNGARPWEHYMMDITFDDENDNFIVIYLDDITVYSDSDEQHLNHLKKVFQKYKKFNILLNPKKSHFGMQEGKLLGHIISKEGINIDPSRVEEILSTFCAIRRKCNPSRGM
jgi:hypothetical protein